MNSLLKNMMYTFRVTRKSKFYKRKILSAIPHYHKPHEIDMHDSYQYRTKEQIRKDLNCEYQIEVHRQIYSEMIPGHEIKDRKAVIEFDIQQFEFTEFQYERFKVLMGTRFKEEQQKGKIVCEMFPDYVQNLEKSLQQLKQVIIESKRAP